MTGEASDTETGETISFIFLNIYYSSILFLLSIGVNRSSSPSTVNKSEDGPPPEDEPEWDASLILLDWYNSDLNLTISKTDFLTASPLIDGGFAYMWAGARGTYGFHKGKVCFEVKVLLIFSV